MAVTFHPEFLLHAYMSVNVGLIVLLYPSFKPATSVRFFFLVGTFSSVVYTWSYMFQYLRKSFVDSAERAGVDSSEWTERRWLESSSLFQEAWEHVCATPERWWWSSQLCLFTVATFTPFLFIEGASWLVVLVWNA